MAHKKVTIEYDRPVVGHPEPGSVVRVELTDTVQAVIDHGFAHEVDSATELHEVDAADPVA